MRNRAAALKKEESKNSRARTPQRHQFSKAVMAIAETNLKNFKSQTDEAFLIRADMDRKLSSL